MKCVSRQGLRSILKRKWTFIKYLLCVGKVPKKYIRDQHPATGLSHPQPCHSHLASSHGPLSSTALSFSPRPALRYTRVHSALVTRASIPTLHTHNLRTANNTHNAQDRPRRTWGPALWAFNPDHDPAHLTARANIKKDSLLRPSWKRFPCP